MEVFMEIWFGIDLADNHPLLLDSVSIQDAIKDEFEEYDIEQDMLDFISVMNSSGEPELQEVSIRTPEEQTVEALEEMRHCFNTIVDNQIEIIKKESD
jgi:hypothetical protein